MPRNILQDCNYRHERELMVTIITGLIEEKISEAFLRSYYIVMNETSKWELLYFIIEYER